MAEKLIHLAPENGGEAGYGKAVSFTAYTILHNGRTITRNIDELSYSIALPVQVPAEPGTYIIPYGEYPARGTNGWDFVVGRFTVDMGGTLTVHEDGTYQVRALVNGGRDVLNFEQRTDREPLYEFATGIGRSLAGENSNVLLLLNSEWVAGAGKLPTRNDIIREAAAAPGVPVEDLTGDDYVDGLDRALQAARSLDADSDPYTGLGAEPPIPKTPSEELVRHRGAAIPLGEQPARGERQELAEALGRQPQPDDVMAWRVLTRAVRDVPQAMLGLAREELMAAYLGIAEQKYLKAKGDIGLAKRLALGEFKTRFGASRLSGKPVVMEQPPEANYPAIDGGWDYLRTSALQQARSSDPAAEEVLLVSHSATLDDRKEGRPPRYALWYRSTGGEWNLAPAPFSVELERLAQLQRSAIEERRSRAAVAVARARELMAQKRPEAL